MDRPQYVNWIVREDGVVFEDQQPLNCYRLSYVRDDAILDDWALHIRKQYVPDGELEEDAALNKLTVEEYLRQYIIPQKGEPFGPTARSNDISEILFADLFEFILNYEVPRCKQHNRSGKNESEHGTDIIAYRFFAEGKAPHKNDELVCSKFISYELSFFVGNVMDIIEINDEDLVNPLPNLLLLQRRLKYGVKTETAVSVCEKIFNDRFLANLLADEIGHDSIEANSIVGVIKSHKDDILDILSAYPTYFSERVQWICKD